MNKKEVVIITIGDELLIGQVIDTNSAWMGERFAGLGVSVRRIVSISDDKRAIEEEIGRAMEEVELVLVTGGLGPTKDDITKSTLCGMFGSGLIFNQDVYDNVEELLLHRIGSINTLNKSQAYVPDNAEIFINKVGTAPIMKFRKGKAVLFSMPGVPYEMKFAIENVVLPYIKNHFRTNGFLHRTIMAVNIAESVLAEQLEKWESALPEHMKLAYLPSPGLIKLRLTMAIRSVEDTGARLDDYCDELIQMLGNNFLADRERKVEEVLGELLTNRNLTIGTAESCTGGMIAQRLTSVPGSSAYFKGSIVAYSNDVKMNLLDVKLTSIEKHGAVSKEVVEEMALGALRRLKCDVAVATSGIAGPDGGTKEKPVGTVWMAWAWEGQVRSQLFTFGKLRNVNIERSARMALTELIYRTKEIKIK